MALNLKKVSPLRLRSLGFNERWLQDRITEDPSLLGLGELSVFAKEHTQPVGGRIDFLMRDEEDETFYEVEIMLGDLDESHIIRAVEYWDIERQRRPQFDHRAVIVAEQITSRFFNVLRLLNRAVPMIVIQLNAFAIDNYVVLHFVKVLDVLEEIDEDVGVEMADRGFWEKKASASLAVMDTVVALLRDAGIEPTISYNRTNISLRTTGRMFCWFHPKPSPVCNFDLALTEDKRDAALASLQQAGFDARPRRNDIIKLNVTAQNLQNQATSLKDVLILAEQCFRA